MADLNLDPEIVALVALGKEAAREAWIRCEGHAGGALSLLEADAALVHDREFNRRVLIHAARNELQVLLARSEAHRAGKDGR